MEEIYTFAGNPLDRVSQRRQDAGWIATLLDDPKTRLLPLRELKPLVRDGSAAELDWQPVAPWRGTIDAGGTLILLGIGDGRAYFALDASAAPAAAGPETTTVDVRALAASIPGGEAAILAEARSLLDWHARHGFCAQCGTASSIDAAGWGRRCPNCRAHHYPRVDPVVIMLAVKGERCLLGRGRRRVGTRFSCLAGFMEPGETIEEAVRREVLEEAGIQIGQVRYLASQPWPFPSTLMMGLLAEALTEEIHIDPEEIAEARWFDREEVRAMVERSRSDEQIPGVTTLPPPLAIGHQLVRRWAFGIDSV
ncbi:MAG TPA: NAD(+) diphosphatase [Stellaceae bacterium]|nr:NAD(+) diphosphatase [Stellaceae bacterium]